MHVWAQRKRAEAAHAAASAKRATAVADVWALRVLAGVHAGAERKLQQSGLLMIGGSDDCDIIFGDAEVAAHHCIVSHADGELSIRAVDADVRIDDRVLHPGDPQGISPFALVHIGGACFAIGPHWSDRWQSVLAKIEPTSVAAGNEQPARPRSGKLATISVALVLLLASTGALVLAQHNAKPQAQIVPAPVRDAELKTLIGSLGYKGLEVTVRNDGALVVSGYVESNEDMANLRAALVQHGFNPTIEAKSGPRIAEDVGETFRMSNLHATTKWDGHGHVMVSGHFGDEKELNTFLVSRTMRDFNESLHLWIDKQNLDPATPEVKKVPDGKRILRVVDGIDPYLISADQSRYYAGARLPRGGTFIGLDNGEVLVRDDADNLRRLPRESVVDASPSPWKGDER
ncbi:MAG: FHA domain-containing protein [Dokdonella sp.]